MRVTGASSSPTITDSSFSSNGDSGFRVDADATATLSNVTISDNAGWAIRAFANSNLAGLTGMTISGNSSGDGVKYEGGTISGSETWSSTLPWYVRSSVFVGETDPNAVLVVEPGTVVKMAENTRIVVDATLTAIGSTASPIVFTSDENSPSPGDWWCLYFRAGSSASRLSHVNVSYGGEASTFSSDASVYVSDSTPQLSHLTITDSDTRGLKVDNAEGLVVTNSVFARNNWAAVANVTPSTPLVATLNYWDSSDGPSGTGPGAGETVGDDVLFDPWLVALPSEPQFLTAALPLNRTFSPGFEIYHKVDFLSVLAGDWFLRYYDDQGVEVREFSGQGAAGSTIWDGKDEGGILQPEGTYTYEIGSTTASGDSATLARGHAVLGGEELSILLTDIPDDYFSPNGDGIQDVAGLAGAFNFDEVSWQVDVKASGAVVSTFAGQGDGFAVAWDGTSSSGQLQPDGDYVLELSASVGQSSLAHAEATTLDNTLPQAIITDPLDGALVSNVHQGGSTLVSFVGTASDLNFENWYLNYGVGAQPGYWYSLSSASLEAFDEELHAWDTAGRENGSYTIRLQVWDQAGNTSEATIVLNIGNFSASFAPLAFDGSAGESVTYASIVPFELDQTMEILDEEENLVKTLFSGTRAPASTSIVGTEPTMPGCCAPLGRTTIA